MVNVKECKLTQTVILSPGNDKENDVEGLCLYGRNPAILYPLISF